MTCDEFILRSAGPSAPYTMIANSFLQNRELPADLIAMIADLISRPPNWRAGTKYLQGRWGWGKNKSREMIRLGIERGYMQRHRMRKPDGTFGRTELFASDDPAFLAKRIAELDISPAPENRAMDEPAPYQPAPGFTSARKQGDIQRKESLQSKDSKKPPHTSDARFHSYGAGAPCGGVEDFDLKEVEQASPPHSENQNPAEPEASESFERFRNEYPDGKADVFSASAWRVAQQRWLKLTDEEQNFAIRFACYAKPEGRKFAQNPANWLEAKPWEPILQRREDEEAARREREEAQAKFEYENSPEARALDKARREKFAAQYLADKRREVLAELQNPENLEIVRNALRSWFSSERWRLKQYIWGGPPGADNCWLPGGLIAEVRDSGQSSAMTPEEIAAMCAELGVNAA